MTDDGLEAAGGHDELRAELAKEGLTMALYVAICLLAGLTAVSDEVDHGEVRLLAIVWGTAIGLALAHWFAFRLSARLVTPEGLTAKDAAISAAQVGGAAGVAILASIPVLVTSPTAEFDIARILLALFIALMGYLVARSNGSSRIRAVIYGAVILVVGVGIAVTKNVLSGH